MSQAKADDMSIDGQVFKVLVNVEGQHSIWPAGLAAPDGWRQVGPTGSREVCRAFVDQAWTDIAPASLRRARAEKDGQ
jgi:MbtH protein